MDADESSSSDGTSDAAAPEDDTDGPDELPETTRRSAQTGTDRDDE